MVHAYQYKIFKHQLQQLMKSNHNIKSPFPKPSLAFILIVSFILVASIITFAFGFGLVLENDAHLVMAKGQWYRIITAPIAILNAYEFIQCLICLLSLCFFLPVYEKKYSTIWTLYHFFKANIMIQLSKIVLYYFTLLAKRLNVLNMISTGILPYAFYIFLKASEIEPNKNVCKCAPFPVPKPLRTIIVFCLLFFISTEPIACMVVYGYWILTYFPCIFCQKLKCWDGPLLSIVVKLVERTLPKSLLQWERFYTYVSPQQSFKQQTESELDLRT